MCRGVAQFGRALRSGRRGRVFESRHLDAFSRPQMQCLSVFAVFFISKKVVLGRNITSLSAKNPFPTVISHRIILSPRVKNTYYFIAYGVELHFNCIFRHICYCFTVYLKCAGSVKLNVDILSEKTLAAFTVL